MNSTASSPAAAVPAPAAPSVAQREVRVTTYLVAAALVTGAVLQVWLPPGGVTLVAAAFLASVVLVVAGYVVPGRLRETLAGFRFVGSLLFVLAVMAMLGTLIIQMKPIGFYMTRYGGLGKLIVALRLDDIFHGVPFALLMALFGASVIASATLRWPVRITRAGFFVCHIGLLTSLAGAAASATLAIRGRIDLFAGREHANEVRVMQAGRHTGEVAALGFDLYLDKFDLVPYEPEHRVGYYEQEIVSDEQGTHPTWRLKASFDVGTLDRATQAFTPDLVRHRLPSGDSFRLKGVYPDFRPVPDPTSKQVLYGTASQEWHNPAVAMEVQQQGLPSESLMFANRPAPVYLSPTRALVFERREKEVKAYVSHVTAREGGGDAKAVIAVNEPFNLNGWTLYQVNYNPEDPTYSGLDAVYDPGVFWVFTGFALICVGVLYMFYVEPRLKRKAAAAKA